MSAPGFSYSLGTCHDAVISALGFPGMILSRASGLKIIQFGRIDPDEIINRLGWLDAPAETLKKIKNIRSTLQPLISGGIKDAVLLGMGGSSLGAEVFNKIFGSSPGHPRLHIMDTTDPALIAATSQNLELEKTIFLVSSKSGTTLEVTSLFQYFYQLGSEKN